MPIDSSIALQVKPPKFMGPADAISLQQLAQQQQMGQVQLQEAQRKQQEQQQLRQVFSQQDAVDPKTGMPTAVTLSNVDKINPQTGMQIRQTIQKQIAEKTTAELNRLKVNDAQNNIIQERLSGVIAEHEANSRRIGPEADRQLPGLIQKAADEIGAQAGLSPEAIQKIKDASSVDQLIGIVGGSKQFKDMRGATKPEDAAPRMRTRIDGSNEIQEQWNPQTHKWDQLGTGPRFAKQVAPVINTGDAKSPYSNVQADGKGGFVGLNKKTGIVEQLPTAPGVSKGGEGKVIPSPIVKAYTENSTALRKIDDALKAGEAYPDAFGLANMAGDTIRQRTDPKGVKARALAADIGSLKIHDRSGAAVTAAETPRLKPFIPNVNDKWETIKDKLNLFKREYEAIQQDLGEIYSPDQGYKALPTGNRGAASDAPKADKPGWKLEKM